MRRRLLLYEAEDPVKIIINNLTADDILASGSNKISSGAFDYAIYVKKLLVTTGATFTWINQTSGKDASIDPISGDNLGTNTTLRTSKGFLEGTIHYTYNGKEYTAKRSVEVFQVANTSKLESVLLLFGDGTDHSTWTTNDYHIGATGGTVKTALHLIYRYTSNAAQDVYEDYSSTPTFSSDSSWINANNSSDNTRGDVIVLSRGTVLGDARTGKILANYSGLSSNTLNIIQAENAIISKLLTLKLVSPSLDVSAQETGLQFLLDLLERYSSGDISEYSPDVFRSMVKTSVDWIYYFDRSVTTPIFFVMVNGRGTIEGTVRTGTIWIEDDGVKSNPIVITLQANVIEKSSYTSQNINITATPLMLSGNGGTSTITATATRVRTDTYSSGSVKDNDESSTPTLSISGAGFTLLGNTVTASEYTGTTERSCTVTASMWDISKSVTISQSAATITYGKIIIDTVNIKIDLIPASGGSINTQTAVVPYSQSWGYNGKLDLPPITTGAKITFSNVSAGSKSTNESGETDVALTTIIVSLNGVTASTTVMVKLAANAIVEYGELTGGAVIYEDIPAAGGNTDGRGRTNPMPTLIIRYTSGATRNGKITTTWDRLVAGSLLDEVVKTKTKAAGTCHTLFTGEGGKSKTIDTVVYYAENKVESTDNKGYVLNVEIDKDSVPNVGGEVKITKNECIHTMVDTYSSTYKKTRTETLVPDSITVSGNGFTLSADKTKITVSSYTGSDLRTGILTIKYKTFVTKTINIVQAAGVRTYGPITITEFTVDDIPANGGTISKASKLVFSQSYGYNGAITGNLADTSTAKVTYLNSVSGTNLGTGGPSGRTYKGDLQVKIEMNGESITPSAKVYQEGNVITNYGELTGYSAGCGLIPAKGGDTSSLVYYTAASQIITYKSGSTRAGKTTQDATNATVVAGTNATLINGTTIKVPTLDKNGIGARKVGTRTVTFKGEDNSKEAHVTYDVFLASNVPTVVNGTWAVTISADPSAIDAKGGESTITTSATRTNIKNYPSGSTEAVTETATPTLSISGAGFTLEGNKVKAGAYTQETERKCTVTATYQGVSLSVIITQSKATRTYSDIVITSFTVPTVPAAGGEVISGDVHYTLTWGYNGASTGGGTITDTGLTITYSPKVTIPSRGVNINTEAIKVGTFLAVVSGNGKSSTASADIKLEPNTATYNIPTVTMTYDPIPARGGQVTPKVSYTLKVTYTSKAEQTLTTGGTLKFSGTSVNTSTGAVSAASRGNNASSTTRVITTSTVQVTINGKSKASNPVEVLQAANNVKYGPVKVSLSYNKAPASGATLYPLLSYSLVATYDSEATETITNKDATLIKYQVDGVNSNNGVITVDNLTTTLQNTEQVVHNVSVEVIMHFIHGTATAEVRLEANTSKSTYSAWAVSIAASPSAEIVSTGGSVTITHKATRTKTTTYDSGSITSTTEIGATTLYILGDGFSLSGNTVTVGKNPTSTERTCTITAMYLVTGSAPVTGLLTLTQLGMGRTYGDITIKVFRVTLAPARGKLITEASYLSYEQSYTLDDGTTGTITEDLDISYSAPLEAKNLKNLVTQRQVIGLFTVTVSGHGKSATKTIDVLLSANLAFYSTPTISVAYDTVPARKATVTPTISFSQTVSYTSETKETLTTYKSISYSGNLVNSLTGAISVDSLGTEETDAGVLTTVTATITSENKNINASDNTYTATATVNRAENKPKYDDIKGTVLLTTIPAEGGFTKYLNDSLYQWILYDSGEGRTPKLNTAYYTVYGSSVLKGGMVQADSLGTTPTDALKNVGTLIIVVTGEGGKSLTLRIPVYQDINSETKSPWMITLGAKPSNSISADGGSVTINTSATRILTYTSKATKTITGSPVLSKSDDSTSAFTLSGTASGATVSAKVNNTSSSKTCRITATIND